METYKTSLSQFQDSNIINIPLEQIGNKASSPIGGYCDQAFERVSVFV